MENIDIQQAPLTKSSRIFKGAEGSPLLAPRGVFIKHKQLFAADTAQNRLFIWKKLPTEEYQQPDVVLGQSAKANTGRNASGKVNASSLFYPSGPIPVGMQMQQLPRLPCNIRQAYGRMGSA